MAKRPRCASCDSLPEAIPAAGTLYLAAPLLHTQEIIAQVVAQAGLVCERPDDSILKVSFSDDTLPEVLERLDERLSSSECSESRVLLLREGEQPELSTFLLADRLAMLIKRSRSRWLVDILATSALVTHFQPIVSSHDPRDVYGY